MSRDSDSTYVNVLLELRYEPSAGSAGVLEETIRPEHALEDLSDIVQREHGERAKIKAVFLTVPPPARKVSLTAINTTTVHRWLSGCMELQVPALSLIFALQEIDCVVGRKRKSDTEPEPDDAQEPKRPCDSAASDDGDGGTGGNVSPSGEGDVAPMMSPSSTGSGVEQGELLDGPVILIDEHESDHMEDDDEDDTHERQLLQQDLLDHLARLLAGCCVRAPTVTVTADSVYITCGECAQKFHANRHGGQHALALGRVKRHCEGKHEEKPNKALQQQQQLFSSYFAGAKSPTSTSSTASAAADSSATASSPLPRTMSTAMTKPDEQRCLGVSLEQVCKGADGAQLRVALHDYKGDEGRALLSHAFSDRAGSFTFLLCVADNLIDWDGKEYPREYMRSNNCVNSVSKARLVRGVRTTCAPCATLASFATRKNPGGALSRVQRALLAHLKNLARKDDETMPIE